MMDLTVYLLRLKLKIKFPQIKNLFLFLFSRRWNFYRKYTEAYGIPVVSSYRVSDKALRRACHITRFLFADRYDLRNAFFQNQGRYAVIAIGERKSSTLSCFILYYE